MVHKRNSKRTTGKVSKNVKSYVRKQFNNRNETNAFQVVDIENVLASTAQCQVINLNRAMNFGDGEGQRQREIKAFGLHLNYILLSSGVSVTIPQYVRVMIINCLENQFDAITDLFLRDPSGGAGTAVDLTASLITDVISPLNKRGYSVLYDRTHKLEGQAEGAGSSSVKVKKFLKFNHKRKWDDIDGSTDSSTNNLRMLILNREIDNDTNTVTCEWSLFSSYYYKQM